MRYILTRDELVKLENLLKAAEASHKAIVSEGVVSGMEQDGWHDEGFQLSTRRASLSEHKISQIRSLLASAEIVDPVDQNTIVRIGNGVVVSYSDGKQFGFVLGGTTLGFLETHRVSVFSSLGDAVLGGRVGDVVQVPSLNGIHDVRIIRIYPPNCAVEAIK